VELSPGLDPKDYFYLVKYEIKGKKVKDRYVEAFTSKAGMFGGGGGLEKSDKQKVAISFTKIRDGIYEIKPESTLSKGEYGFSFAVTKMFSFGID